MTGGCYGVLFSDYRILWDVMWSLWCLYRVLFSDYGVLWDAMGSLWGAIGCYSMTMGCYGMLWGPYGVLFSDYRLLWDAMGCYGVAFPSPTRNPDPGPKIQHSLWGKSGDAELNL